MSEMIPDKVPKEDVFHGSEDLKKEAHISSFEKYKELYVKSVESPDGKFPLWHLNPSTCHRKASCPFQLMPLKSQSCSILSQK